ncbi:MAG: hypothetical protein ACI4FX_10765 [Agathobacter sp.]
MNKKKFMAFMMAAAVMATALPANTFAESVGGGTKVLTEADLDENNQKDVSIPVEYTVGATFTVKLPSAITLSNTDGSWGYSGTVGVKGDIDSGKAVKVTPAESITMYDVTNRPTDDVPAGADDQAYSHKDAKDAMVAQTKQQWGMTELNTDTYSDTDLTLAAGELQSGKWKGTLPVEIRYEAPAAEAVTLTEGETYTLGGYSWVAAENKNGYTVLQSTGVTAGYWPGYTMAKWGNGSSYGSNIDGQDISGYDDKTTDLYNSIKSAEYAGADYGTGLYLVSNAMAGTTTYGSQGSGNYWAALKTAAENYSSFGDSYSNSWLGTVGGSDYAWFVDSDGNVYYDVYQNNSFVVAPAFNLDTSKVTLEGNAITVK